MSAPISFDRAVEYYDETRGFPPGIAEQVSDSLLSALPEAAWMLEIGVGTGRIALPLMQRGLALTGLDVSRKMMARLAQKWSASSLRTPLRLVQGDATRLPLAPGLFDAVLGVHIFHLISESPAALEEARRVLKPGGSLLIGLEQRPEGDPYSLIGRKFKEIAASYGSGAHPSTRLDLDQITQAILASGAEGREWIAAKWESTTTLDQRLERLHQRMWSSTWEVPEEHFEEAIARLRAWAVQEFGRLDRPMRSEKAFIWRQYRWR